MDNTKKTGAFGKTVDSLLKVCAIICMALLVVIFSVTVLQVFCRFVLKHALVWCEELCRYCGIWLVMLSTSIAIEKRSHMSLDLVTGKLGAGGQRALLIFSDLLVLVMSVYMTVASYKLCVKFWATLSTALRVPMGIVYIGVVAGWAISIIAALYNLLVSLKVIKEEEA